MARANTYTYDPKTGKWSKSSSSSGVSTTGNDSSLSSSPQAFNKPSNDGNQVGGGNLTSSTGNSNSSSGSTEKKYNTIELNTLVGTISFVVNDKTIRLKVGDTIKLNGLGKYLSGNYYVKEISRIISDSGYSHTAVLVRPDFGSSLKSSTSIQIKDAVPTPDKSKTEEGVSKIKKVSDTKSNKLVSVTVKNHVASAIWKGNYGWSDGSVREHRLTEVFGINNGIQEIVNLGYDYSSKYSPVGYSYNEMKAKFCK